MNTNSDDKCLELQSVIEALQMKVLDAENIINSQTYIIHDRNIELLNLKEQLDYLVEENASSDKLMGYSPNMSFQDKLKLNEESEKELERAKNCLSESVLRDYETEMEKEDRLIDCALEQNKLQFEIAELFKSIKSQINDENIEEYKKYKRNFYTIIDGFCKIISTGTPIATGVPSQGRVLGASSARNSPATKLDMFDTLIEILEKQKKVYELDDEIKNLK